jgi:hypothetical protein
MNLDYEQHESASPARRSTRRRLLAMRALVTGALATLGLSGATAAAGSGCGPDREQLAKDVHERVRAELDRKIEQEVERRLREELPRLEARLRSRLAGGPDRAAAPRRRARPRHADPGSPAPDPARRPAVALDAGAGGGAAGPPAVPPATLEKEVEAPGTDPQGLEIARVLLARKVEDRKPVGEASSFSLPDERVYCYIDAKNPKGPERKLRVVWHHDGKVFHQVRLRVGVGHVWRTWAYVRLRKGHEGNWRCAVFNEQDQRLAAKEFTVTAEK